MSKVKIGFIGAGGMAEHHMKTLQRIEQAEIVAIHDINAERAAQVAKTYGADVYENGADLINSGSIDALFVCTPQFARDDLDIVAAGKGIHLFAEKPVGLNLEDVRRKSKVIRDAGIINSSGYCLRYMQSANKAKAYLQDKTINMVMTYRIGGLPPMPWWAQQHLSGGQMVDQSTHQVDLVRYLTGSEFVQAQALYAQRSIRRDHPEATIPDVGAVSFVLDSGAVGSISNGCTSRHYSNGDVEVIGGDFYLRLSINKLTIRDDNQELDEELPTDFYYEQDRAFVEAVATGRQELVLGDFAEAVATLEATLAFGESAAGNGQPVTLPR